MRVAAARSFAALVTVTLALAMLPTTPAGANPLETPAPVPVASEAPESAAASAPPVAATPLPAQSETPPAPTPEVPGPEEQDPDGPTQAPPAPSPTAETVETPDALLPPTDTLPVPSGAPESRPLSPNTVQCYGSSSIDYLCGGGHLGAHMPGWSVLNHGVGSIGPVAIGVIAGIYPTVLGRDVVLPASGSTNIGGPWNLPVAAKDLGRITFDVEIGGVRGRITHFPDLADASQHWKFTRSGSGAAVRLPAGTPITSLEQPLPGSSSVLWVGANGIEDMARVKEVISKIVEAGDRVGAKSYVLQLPPRWDFTDWRNSNRHQVNDWIRQSYGERAIPLADYLSNGALVDAGLVPTQADRDTIAMGLNPRSFWMAWDDTTHMNAIGMSTAGRYLAKWVQSGYTYSQAILRFDANSSAEVGVVGSRVSIRGHAFDLSDLYASIPVGITIDGAWRAVTADQASPQLGSFGVPGRHGYSLTVELAPGDHVVCTVGIGFGAGQHSYPPCQTVHVQRQAAPVGGFAVADASARTKAVYGWSYAPDDAGRALPVAITVDGSWHHLVAADRPSPYLSGVPGSHAFLTTVSFAPGTHRVCAVAIESSSNLANLGCQDVTIR